MSEPEKEDLSIKEATDEVEEDEDVEFFTESNKFKQMLFENLHGISKKFNMKYPINPKITYEYPPINPVICQNIIAALYKYPNFYTQTLHLMNKMNLPCPLVDYVREPCVNYFPTTSQTQVSQTTNTLETEAKTVEESSSESEIETDFDPRSQQPTVAPAESQIKKVNVKSLLKSSVAKSSSKDQPESTKIDEVFDRTDI